jgi:recombination protein RecA
MGGSAAETWVGSSAEEHVEEQAVAAVQAWSIGALAGRLVEVTHRGAGTAMTWAAELLWQAQQAGEPTAWICTGNRLPFAPDLIRYGVDLEACAVVRTGEAQQAAVCADKLLRSGAFGLVVLDLGERADIPTALLGRLTKLAQTHSAAIVMLTEGEAASAALGSLVSLRLLAEREVSDGGESRLLLTALKDKRSGPGWNGSLQVQQPLGLR